MPGDGDADEAIVKLRVCHRRRVVPPNLPLKKVLRQQYGQSVNSGDYEQTFANFMVGCRCSLSHPIYVLSVALIKHTKLHQTKGTRWYRTLCSYSL